jgi:A/G-specific adenine glycosylase
MLQQTQVARVVPRYEAFLTRFPDERALSEAPAGEVLREWSGLGYNRRALALRRAARTVAEQGWPPGSDGLRGLAGVGPYTAAAVASFAFGEQVAAVDTNVARVIERLDGVARGPAALRRRATELLPAGRAAEWNQAMMELGATLCTARRPRCGLCPVAAGCASRDAPPSAPRARSSGPRPRFEDTERYVRGRVLAALVEGGPPPAHIEPPRLAAAVAGLERDGLVVRDGERLSLPG